MQILFDDTTLECCCTVYVNAQNKVEQHGRQSEPFTSFTDFLQSLTSVLNRAISYPDAKEVLLESLSFENANAKYKKVVKLLAIEIWLNARSTPIL